MNEGNLTRAAIKRIMIVFTAGVLLILFDLFIGFDIGSLSLMDGGDGKYLVRPDAGDPNGHIRLRATVETDEGNVTKTYDLSLYPYEEASESGESGDNLSEEDSGAMSEDELLGYEIRTIISSLNDDKSVRRVSLPDHLRTGEKVSWEKNKSSNTPLIVFAVMILAVLIYRTRLAPLEKLRHAQMESVTRQLPEFVNRLVLLLNAGLVLSSAFERIVEESRLQESLRDDYFYSRMAVIYDRITETNGSMAKEFRAFARSGENSGEGSRELMRISNIISDNISKGVELTDKLQSESEALWLARRRGSEERGRLAETKLTLPLTVFLLVLVVITVSPALLEL